MMPYLSWGLPPLVSRVMWGESAGCSCPLLLKSAVKPDHVLGRTIGDSLLTLHSSEPHSFSIACLAAFTAAVRVFHSRKQSLAKRTSPA